jgi:hypothetical protein
MTTADDRPPVPPALRAAVAQDLRPVTPLAPPRLRVFSVVPFALLLLVAAVIVFGVRADAPSVGPVLTWGASTLQMMLGLTLVALALREAVPGTTLSRRALGLAIGTAAIAVMTITWMTWSSSSTRLAPPALGYVWRVCFGATILSALPALAVSGWLVARAFPLRPRIAGALYGLGSGLMADAGWRLFCHFSNPGHVFGAHTAAVVVTGAIGVAVASLWPALESRRETHDADIRL